MIGTNEIPIIIVGNKRDLQRGRVIPRRNVSNLVKKTWKCGYIECSAKYNWHILMLFNELLKTVGLVKKAFGTLAFIAQTFQYRSWDFVLRLYRTL
eukprot:g30642.t1